MSTTILAASALGGILATSSAITGIEKGRGWKGLLFITGSALTAGLIAGLGFFILNPEIQTFSFCPSCQNEPLFSTVPETGLMKPISASIGASIGAGLTTYIFEPETQQSRS